MGRHQRIVARQQVGHGAVLIDGVVEDHRIHGEGQGRREAALGFQHQDLKPFLGLHFPLRRKDETHAAAGHPTEHPEAPEIGTEFGFALLDEPLGEVVGGPRDDGLQRLPEIARGGLADAADIPSSKCIDDLIQDSERLLAARPFGR